MKVLVCDDHQLLAEALGGALRRRGDQVKVTTRPGEAVAIALDWQPAVCLMDRHFPEGDAGLEGTRQVLHVSPGTRVIVLTGDGDGEAARAALAAGARGFLRKNEPLETIIAAMDTVAAGMVAVTEGVLRTAPALATHPLTEQLTPREQAVLELLVRGAGTREIALELDISYNTSRAHTQAVLTKLRVHSRLEAAAAAVRRGLVAPRVPSSTQQAPGARRDSRALRRQR